MTPFESGQLPQSSLCDQHAVEVPKREWLSLLSRWLLPSLIVLFLVPFFVLFFYAVPALDDFCKATLSFNAVPQKSAFSITWMYYTQWSPRWLTTFIQSIVMSHIDLAKSYGWLLLAVALSNIGALWYFFKTVFRLSSAGALQAAGVFYTAYVASLGDPAQQLFWVTGAIEYNLSLSTLLILVSLLYQARAATWYYCAIGILSFAIPAQHEIAGTLLLAVLAGGIIFSKIRRLPALQWYVSFLAAIMSQVIVMLSPGNALRAAQEHRHLWDLAHLPRWVGHSFYHGIGWLSQPAILLAGCCIILLTLDNQSKQVTGIRLPLPLGFVGLFAMFALCCEIALVETASGVWIPNRVVAWFQFVFWLLFICVLLTGVPELQRIRGASPTKLGIIFLFGFTVFGSENFRAAISDLRGPARIWWQLNDSRLHQPGGPSEFCLPTPYPRLAIPQMLTSDSGCWVNRCLANYLHFSTDFSATTVRTCR